MIINIDAKTNHKFIKSDDFTKKLKKIDSE